MWSRVCRFPWVPFSTLEKHFGWKKGGVLLRTGSTPGPRCDPLTAPLARARSSGSVIATSRLTLRTTLPDVATPLGRALRTMTHVPVGSDLVPTVAVISGTSRSVWVATHVKLKTRARSCAVVRLENGTPKTCFVRQRKVEKSHLHFFLVCRGANTKL